MAHVRQQIREAAATLLTGLSTTGSRVYQSRIHPLDATKLPCLLVNTDDETVAQMSVHAPGVYDRRLTLAISCVAKAASNLDDTLDTMAAEVETALGNSPTISGKAKDSALAGITVEMEQGDKPVGIATLRYEVNYFTAGNAPTTAI